MPRQQLSVMPFIPQHFGSLLQFTPLCSQVLSVSPKMFSHFRPCFSFSWTFSLFPVSLLSAHGTIVPIGSVWPCRLEFIAVLVLSLDPRSSSSFSITMSLIFELWFYSQECRKFSLSVSDQQVEPVSLLTGLDHFSYCSYLEASYFFELVLDKTLGFALIYFFLLSSAGYVDL